MSDPTPSAAVPGCAPRRILLIELAEDGSVGGSHRCLVDLVRNLDRKAFRPVVAFHEENPYLQELRGQGIEAHLLPTRRSAPALRRSPLARAAHMGAVVRDRAGFLRMVGAELLHLNNSPQNGGDDWLPAARWSRIPCITHARGFPWPGTGWVTRALSRRFDQVIAISRCIESAWLAEGIPARGMQQIYDGVDGSGVVARVRRAPAEVRAELGVPAGRVLVAMVGHIKTWKGQDVLLRALAGMPAGQRSRFHLVFVGGRSASEDDSYSRKLDEIIAAAVLAPNVEFLGARQDAPEIMNAADIVVHASTTPEPFGLVVVEGLVLGKPVIASRLGGPGEVIRPGTGLLFDPAHPGELADHLVRLAADPGLRNALGEAGKRLAGEFDILQNVRSIEAVYRSHLPASA